MKECCYQSVFGRTAVRLGRCNYQCNKCGQNVSMLWAFYELSVHEDNEEKVRADKYKKALGLE